LLGRFSAPALGGIILASSAIDDTLGFSVLYTICGITGLTALFAIYLLPKIPQDKPARTTKNVNVHVRQEMLELLLHKGILVTCSVEAAILFAYGIFETFLPLRGINIGMSTWEIGLCISAQIFTIAISKPVLGRLSDRHGRRRQIVWGGVLAGGCMLSLAFSLFTLLACSVLLGLSISIVTSASAAHIADLSQTGNHGAAMGMLGSLMDIGHATGPIVGGILAVSFNLTVAFLSGTMVLLLSIFCFIYFYHKQSIF